jgi:hypothetical protein
MFALKFVMKTTPTTYAIVVPIPTLPVLLTVIGALEFPILVPLPVKTGTVPAVPLPVTCAAALIANNARPNPIKLARVRIVQRPLCFHSLVFCAARFSNEHGFGGMPMKQKLRNRIL